MEFRSRNPTKTAITGEDTHQNAFPNKRPARKEANASKARVFNFYFYNFLLRLSMANALVFNAAAFRAALVLAAPALDFAAPARVVVRRMQQDIPMRVLWQFWAFMCKMVAQMFT